MTTLQPSKTTYGPAAVAVDIRLLDRLVVRLMVLLSLLVAGVSSGAQSVTEIVTDFGGYWQTASTAVNPVEPNNDHNLLSFSFNNTRYSTGVNDALLNSHGLTYVPGDFRALPFQNINGTVNGNTKIGLGALADGVANGAGAAPSRAIGPYLSDGANGLNIGTCIANLPTGTMFLSVSNLKPENIGDGIPDILVTQIADPSNTYDRYAFTDVNGAPVGNHMDIVLTNITPVGTWTADFYEATGSTILQGGYTQTDRAMRLWAADLSAFGISAANIGDIAYFKIDLSGTSDIAFVAYNNNTLNVQQILPVQFTSFTAQLNNSKVELKWSTGNGTAADEFSIETSNDGIHFTTLHNISISSAGNKYSAITEAPASGAAYYRIREAGKFSNTQYSRIAQITGKPDAAIATVFPNPATSLLNITHASASGNEKITLYNSFGGVMLQKQVYQGATRTSLQTDNLPKGVYHLSFTNGRDKYSQLVAIQ